MKVERHDDRVHLEVWEWQGSIFKLPHKPSMVGPYSTMFNQESPKKDTKMPSLSFESIVEISCWLV